MTIWAAKQIGDILTTQKGGTTQGVRSKLNVVGGTNVTLTLDNGVTLANAITIDIATTDTGSGLSNTIVGHQGVKAWTTSTAEQTVDFAAPGLVGGTLALAFMDQGVGVGVGRNAGRDSITVNWSGTGVGDSPRTNFGYYYFYPSTFIEWYTGANDMIRKRAGGSGSGHSLLAFWRKT